MRKGLIVAKSLRMTSVVGVDFDLKQLEIVEDLNIDDYIPSHMLKNCILLICTARTESDTFITCKYVWADLTYYLLIRTHERKYLRSWHGQTSCLTDCRKCHTRFSCCKNRIIRIALAKKIRHWLLSNINALHEGNICNCDCADSVMASDALFMQRLARGELVFSEGGKVDVGEDGNPNYTTLRYRDEEVIKIRDEYFEEDETVLHKLQGATFE